MKNKIQQLELELFDSMNGDTTLYVPMVEKKESAGALFAERNKPHGSIVRAFIDSNDCILYCKKNTSPEQKLITYKTDYSALIKVFDRAKKKKKYKNPINLSLSCIDSNNNVYLIEVLWQKTHN